jgi:hypothetical protein
MFPQIMGSVIALVAIGAGICFIKFAPFLSDWAYDVSDSVSKKVYLWGYRIGGIWFIGFGGFMLYLIFFS